MQENTQKKQEKLTTKKKNCLSNKKKRRKSTKPSQRKVKKRTTFYYDISYPNFEELIESCKKHNLSISKVVRDSISLFYENKFKK